MADLPPSDPREDPRVASDRAARPGTPRWVKVSGIIAAVVAVAIVIVALAGGEHGPGRHMPGGDTGGNTSSVQHSS